MRKILCRDALYHIPNTLKGVRRHYLLRDWLASLLETDLIDSNMFPLHPVVEGNDQMLQKPEEDYAKLLATFQYRKECP
jgi:hypothetical protein